MKKLILFAIGLMLMPVIALAQTVPGFSYQAIARDANGEVIADKTVGVQITILKDAVDGEIAYVEEFFPTTNSYGVINLTIGSGSPTYGVFQEIDWSVGQYFIGVGLDTEGNTDFVDMSTSQLLSVPYAMYAKSAETAQSVKDFDASKLAKIESSINDVKTQLKSVTYELMGSGSFTDERDGEVYTWVREADNKVWMVDNLRAETFTDGSPIKDVKAYNNDPVIAEEYGNLYTYESLVLSGKQVCPDGYRMPTEAEWVALLSKYGGPVFAGAKMKEPGTFHWSTEASGITNDSQAGIIPAGLVNAEGESSNLGKKAYLWTSTKSADNPDYAVAYQFTAEHNIVLKVNIRKDAALSIRCIKIE
jgi:uncharacterized protein (TIGR02145 family)